MQSKHILHNTGKQGSGDADTSSATLEKAQSSLVSDQSQGTTNPAGELDLQRQPTGVKVRDFTWDRTFPFPFVVVFSHAALTVTLRDRVGYAQMPVAAQGTLAISDLPQGTSTHSVVMSRGKDREVCF